jgi:arabinofuranan 3-O-arabinosyltransferase
MKKTLTRPTTESARLYLGLAAVAYVPLILTQRGWVSADTKTYLYLDPAKLLSRAWSMWDPSVGLGTVTHQNIGYLWPQGPFYWVFERLGAPDWLAQRIWWGTIVFAAGSGVVYLLRKLGWTGPAVAVAAFVYALSPYLLTLVARLSAILLPFAALPWLVAFTMLTVRTKGWRYPALFALTVATCGSVNATALLLVGLAPALWLAHAVWVADDATPRTGLKAVLRIGVVTVPVSAWWIAGLTVQGTNGIEILRYTETAKIVAGVSVSHEVLRGLGYWFFYGGDRLGPWIEPSDAYTQNLPLLAITYLIPVLGLVGAVISRWRHRAYFVLLVVVGTALAVGAYPWEGGPPWARAVRAFLESDTGLAMRSLPRAVPLVALGLAVLLGSGIASVVRRWPRFRRPLVVGGVALAILALPPLWLGQFVPQNLRRSNIPDYWNEAAAYLDQQSPDNRVLLVPGSDFASYRWGNTVDPLLPGLIDRPSVARELIPYGSPASANLLNAFDRPLQERTADPDSVAAIARLMRAGQVVVQSDLQYERYNTPRPRNFWDFMTKAPGLGEPREFGQPTRNLTIPEVQLDDELLFLTDPSLPDPPPVASFDVDDPLDIVSAHPTDNPLLVAGDGDGLVDAAGEGLIDGTELIRYTADLDADEISAALDDGAALLLTDSNRKRGERWTTVRHTRGYTETAEDGALETDPTDNRLPVFPDQGTESQTVAVNEGDIEASATSYGNPITFTSEERPSNAVDGDPDTAWRAGAFSDARGQRLELRLADTVTTDHMTLTQPTGGARNRFITEVRLRFDGGDTIDVPLTAQSHDVPGQVVEFPEQTFDTVSIEILADTAGDAPRFQGFSSEGFAEVAIGDDSPTATELIQLPTDLLEAAGPDSNDQPLAVSLTRQRQDPTDVTRDDEEESLMRRFQLPSSRSFGLSGEARLSGRADADVIDELLGRAHDGSVPWVRASDDLTGSVATPAAAFDGDDSTAWNTRRSAPEGAWVEVNLPEPATVDSIPLTVVADGLHSVPNQVEVSVDDQPPVTVPVRGVETGDRQNATSTVQVELPEEMTGSRFRIRLSGVTPTMTNDWVGGNAVAQPAAIAEIGLPGPKVPALPDRFDTGCRDGLLTVDGESVPLRITGTMDDAMSGGPLDVTTCGNAAVDLDGGTHDLRAAPGLSSGIDLNQLVLRSAAGGEASTETTSLVAEAEAGSSRTAGASRAAGATPSVEIVDQGHDHVRARVSGATEGEPFWLALGQSYNEGWNAEAAGEDLGAPRLVNGYANGWHVVAPGETFEIEMSFAPQQRVDLGIIVSVIGGLGCLLLAIRRPRPVARFPTAMPEPYSSVLAFRYEGALPTRGKAVLTGIGLGLFGWLLAGPIIGLAIGVAAGIGARQETFRRWLLIVSPVALALASCYVLYLQFRHAPVPSLDWPVEVRRPHPLGWAAVLFLVADVVVDRVWQARRSDE